MEANGSMGLYQRYRPRRFKDVIGQEAAVSALQSLLKGDTFPKALLFVGSSGCGKTTLARIMRHKLNCDDGDFYEYNSAGFRGIDSARDVDQRMRMRPMTQGGRRIWLFDEVHQWTPDASRAMLKPLEEAPAHVNFFLCTTNPEKLLNEIKTRCTTINCKPVSADLLADLVVRVADKEGKAISKDVAERIGQAANGSPRQALTILESVLGVEGEEEQLEIVSQNDLKEKGEFLGRLLTRQGVSWAEVAKSLREVPETDAEGTRRGVLAYCKSILTSEKGNPPALMARAYLVISIFRYDVMNSGGAGLAAACWEVVNAGRGKG